MRVIRAEVPEDAGGDAARAAAGPARRDVRERVRRGSAVQGVREPVRGGGGGGGPLPARARAADGARPGMVAHSWQVDIILA